MRVAIVGGGMAGLTTAWHLLEGGLTPCVLEASPHIGGLVRTVEVEGRRLELGADTLVTQKPAAVALCRRLGLGGELVFHDARATVTQVLRRGRPLAIPVGTNLLAPTRWAPLLRSRLLSWRGALRLALEPHVPAERDPEHDESLASFVRRRYGREVLDAFVEPVLASLFLADAERLSVRLAMPRLLEAERVHGSVRRAMAQASPDGEARTGRPHAGSGGFASLQGGMGTLPQRLASLLPKGSIRTAARVERVRRTEAHRFALDLAGGERLDADAVVLACPAAAAARVVREIDAHLAAALDALDYSSCATVHLAYRREDVSRPLRGHGFFVPKGAGLPLLACSYVSEKHPERVLSGDVLLRAFVGGARDPQALAGDDPALIERTHSILARILDLRGRPILVHVQRHLRAMPHYRVGEAARLADIAARARVHRGLALTGGLRGAVGIPDVVASAKAAAEDIAAVLGRREPALLAVAR